MSRKKKDVLEHHLSRRERQIMQAVYRLGSASVAEVAEHNEGGQSQAENA